MRFCNYSTLIENAGNIGHLSSDTAGLMKPVLPGFQAFAAMFAIRNGWVFKFISGKRGLRGKGVNKSLLRLSLLCMRTAII